MDVLMECGHTAQATDGNGNPVCAICVGIHPGARKIAVNRPSLEGRFAKCMCGNTVESSYNLAFFEYLGPDSEDSKNRCKCGYFKVAHEYNERRVHKEPVANHPFEPRGPSESDRYYCGCRGWD